MKIIIGITTILLLAVLSVAYLYFSNISVDSRDNDKALAEIPSDASVLLEFPNDRSLYEIFKDYQLFDAITGTQKKEELSWLKDFLLNNKDLYSATQSQKVFLSFHPAPSDSVYFLWLMPLRENLNAEEVVRTLRKDGQNQIKTSETFGNPVIEIKNKGLKKTFYLSIKKGIAKGSFSRNLLLLSIDKTTKKIDPSFIEEINSAISDDENALANLFIDHTNNASFLKPFFKEDLYGNFSLFNNFPAHTSLKLNFKSDALMFNGITKEVGKNNDRYISLFLHQKPVKNNIKRIMPYNTSNSISYGLSDYQMFNNDLQKLFEQRKQFDTLKKQISLITQETGINPDRDIKKLWGNEFSTIQLSTHENLAVIKVSNGRQLQFYLEPLSLFYSDVLRKMNYPNLFYYYLGDPLENFNMPFFAITDNLLIISNSAGTVQRYLNDYNADKLLYKTEGFIKFDQLVADECNIAFFMHFSNSRTLIRSLLKTNYANMFTDDQFGLKDFYGLSYQMISNNNHFFTNLYSGYKSQPQKTDSLSIEDINNISKLNH